MAIPPIPASFIDHRYGKLSQTHNARESQRKGPHQAQWPSQATQTNLPEPGVLAAARNTPEWGAWVAG